MYFVAGAVAAIALLTQQLLAHGQIRWNTLPVPHTEVMPHQSLAIAITRALTGGPQEVPAIASRLAETLGRPETRWLEGLARRYVRAFQSGTRPRERDVVQFVLADAA